MWRIGALIIIVLVAMTTAQLIPIEEGADQDTVLVMEGSRTIRFEGCINTGVSVAAKIHHETLSKGRVELDIDLSIFDVPGDFYNDLIDDEDIIQEIIGTDKDLEDIEIDGDYITYTIVDPGDKLELMPFKTYAEFKDWLGGFGSVSGIDLKYTVSTGIALSYEEAQVRYIIGSRSIFKSSGDPVTIDDNILFSPVVMFILLIVTAVCAHLVRSKGDVDGAKWLFRVAAIFYFLPLIPFSHFLFYIMFAVTVIAVAVVLGGSRKDRSHAQQHYPPQHQHQQRRAPQRPQFSSDANRPEPRPKRTEDAVMDFMSTIPGTGPRQSKNIVDAGYGSLTKLRRASISHLGSVKGCDDQLARKVKTRLNNGYIEFTDLLKGVTINKNTERNLYNAGYWNGRILYDASIDELILVNGVNRHLAEEVQKVVRHYFDPAYYRDERQRKPIRIKDSGECPKCQLVLSAGVSECPECDRPKDGLHQCGSCGNQQPPDRDFCTECGTKMEPPGGFRCSECGALVKDHMAFCPNCGIQSSDEPSEEPAPATPGPTQEAEFEPVDAGSGSPDTEEQSVYTSGEDDGFMSAGTPAVEPSGALPEPHRPQKGSEPEVESQQVDEEVAKFCPFCGRNIPFKKAVKFCPHCGEEFH